MTLRFYDFEFNLLGVENNIIKVRWTILYNGTGTFEAHLPLTSSVAEIVTENRYIVAVQNGFSAIIVGKEFSDELVLYGRTCNWILSKRVIDGFEKTAIKPAEYAVQTALSAFSDVSNFVSENVPDSEDVEFEHGDGLLSELVVDCLKVAELGHELVFDIKNKSWVLNILKGNESELIFSEGHRNAYSTKGAFDIIDLATCGRYIENGDNGDVAKIVVKDEEKTGIYRWEARLMANNEAAAQNELAGKDEKNEITMNVQGVKFGKDYCLGDTVRVQLIKGDYRHTQKRRIKGVEIRMEQGIYTEQPIFE